jgi:hypothetical protein
MKKKVDKKAILLFVISLNALYRHTGIREDINGVPNLYTSTRLMLHNIL